MRVSLVFLCCVATVASWWPWSDEKAAGTCAASSSSSCASSSLASLSSLLDLESLPSVSFDDAAGFAAAMASSGGAVVRGNESAVTKLFGEALGGGVVTPETVATSDDAEGAFALARLVKRDDNALAVVAGPGLAVWTNGKWRPPGKNVETANGGETLAYVGSSQYGPLPEFASTSPFPKYGALSSPSSPACLSVERRATRVRARLNGDGGAASGGVALRPCDFETFDDFVKAGCEKARASAVGDASIADPPLEVAEFSDCDPAKGARCFDGNGTRLTSTEAALALTNYWSPEPPSEAADVWFVPSGTHFIWPTFEAGREAITNVDFFADFADDDDPKSISGRRVVVVRTLSKKPAVFALSNFLDVEEAGKVVERNRKLIKPSEVGLVGRAGDKTRTSSNAWDTNSPMARTLIRRAFELLKIDAERKLEDGLQVLHYEPTQWYKPHVDYFTANNGGGSGVAADAFSNAQPLERNGTNRFATVFLYLADTLAGGETSFPLSTSHASYAGGKLVHPGTVKTPGFIRNEDADWVCNASSDALRVPPRTATAVLFYSQRGDSSLDPYSLHGSCPVVQGDKWAANLWVWNRPRDAIDKAKDSARAQFQVNFLNADPSRDAGLFWRPNGAVGFDKNKDKDDDLQKVSTVPGGSSVNMNTYPGHFFVAKSTDGTTLATFTASKNIPTMTIPRQQPPSATTTEVPYPASPRTSD